MGEILNNMVSKEDSLSMKNRKERARQLKAILLKYRQLSLQQQQEHQGRAKKKSDLEGRKTMALSGLRHKDGTPYNETEKLQVKWLQNELRQKLVYLAYRNICEKWTMPLANWALISQQLAIKFGDRFKIM